MCIFGNRGRESLSDRILETMNPPTYCPQCNKEIPDKEEVSSIRDLLKQCGTLLKEGDAERAKEALESIQNVSFSHLYGKNCAVFSRSSGNEEADDLTSDIDNLFEGLVVRSRRDTSVVRLQLLYYHKYLIFESPESPNRADHIPPWGLDSLSVLELLRYLDPYSEDLRTKKRLLCVYDAIRERWWRRRVPADSPLREMDAADVEKLMFAIMEKGNEVLYFEPPPAAPCWLPNDEASAKINRRFLKHANANGSDKTRRQAIGYLEAPIPAPRLLEEGPFIRIVEMVLNLWYPEMASAKNPINADVICKAIRLVGLQRLKNISQIPENAIREFCFTIPFSLAIEPGDIALFLGTHPDMRLTDYDNEIRALLDEFDPELLAILWLQADSYNRNQIIYAFEKSDLRCARCNRRLPNKAERRWTGLTLEWLGHAGLFELYSREKSFCLCPEKDLGNSGDEQARWRRKRAKLVAAVVLKYPNLDRDRTHARDARFLLKTMTDLMNGKQLRNKTEGTLKRALRRFAEFGDKWLYDKKLEVPGQGEICLADMIDTPLFSDLLRPRSYDQYTGALGELVKMSRLLGQFIDPSQAKILYGSQYPIPRKAYDPDEAVWRRMADDDFNGDPWNDNYQDPDFPDDSSSDDFEFIGESDSPDPQWLALEEIMVAALVANPGMSDSELRDKVYWEHPEHRRNPWLQLHWYKTCDAFPLPGLLGIGGEPFSNGVGRHEFADLKSYIQAVLRGSQFAHHYLDRCMRRDIYDASDNHTDEGDLACSELRVLVKSGRAEPQTMQELEIMSCDELKAKVRENLKARLRAIGDRIALLCSALP